MRRTKRKPMKKRKRKRKAAEKKLNQKLRRNREGMIKMIKKTQMTSPTLHQSLLKKIIQSLVLLKRSPQRKVLE